MVAVIVSLFCTIVESMNDNDAINQSASWFMSMSSLWLCDAA